MGGPVKDWKNTLRRWSREAAENDKQSFITAETMRKIACQWENNRKREMGRVFVRGWTYLYLTPKQFAAGFRTGIIDYKGDDGWWFQGMYIRIITPLSEE